MALLATSWVTWLAVSPWVTLLVALPSATAVSIDHGLVLEARFGAHAQRRAGRAVHEFGGAQHIAAAGDAPGRLGWSVPEASRTTVTCSDPTLRPCTTIR